MVAKYTTYPCNTAEELWENLNPLNEQNYPKTSKYIFRGQANSYWGLKPSIFRNIPETNIEKQASRQLFYEWNLLKNFIEFCNSIGLPIPNDSYEFRNQYFDETKTYFPQTVIKNQSLFMNDNLLELIALAQHSGVPTRLLDWSYDSYVAAFFAASSAIDLKDNPHTHFAIWAFDTIGAYDKEKLKVITLPYAYNPNMRSQKGCFTYWEQDLIRGKEISIKNMEEIKGLPLKKFKVPISEAKKILNFCDKHGINHATIFPNYEGAGKASVFKANQDRKIHLGIDENETVEGV